MKMHVFPIRKIIFDIFFLNSKKTPILKDFLKKFITYNFLILAILLAIFLNLNFFHVNTYGQDIYYAFIEGNRILNGINPYERVLQGNMRQNQKYATWFPLFFLLSALTQFLGLNQYSDWIFFWRIIFLIFYLAIAVEIFIFLKEKNQDLIGLFSAIFWLFSRWTIIISYYAFIEFLPLFFLLLSLYFLEKNKNLSFLLYGLSLSLKQIGIFLFPIYIIWILKNSSNQKVKSFLFSIILIIIIPLSFSLPFIIWNPEGFIKSILFSATRNPQTGFKNVKSIDWILGLVGIIAKTPLILLLIIVYYCFYKEKIQIFTSCLFTMITFINYNSVLFQQYMVWDLPFFFLLILDFVIHQESEQSKKKLAFNLNHVLRARYLFIFILKKLRFLIIKNVNK
ncbi:MAG: hypothetical protein ACTSXH_01285 [Promethearchaeota archaeon]